MEWFYATNNQQRGPVSGSQLDDLVRTGAVQRDTLVWRSGMASWQPMHSVRSLPSPTSSSPPVPGGAPPVAGPMATCVECHRLFAQTDLAFLNHSWVCAQCKPIFLQRMIEGAAPGSAVGVAWRSGSQMVTRPGAVLPDRCVRCNEPTNGFRMKRTLYWHNPLWYLLILVSLLIYAIVAICIRKKAIVHVGLCEKHRSSRKWTIVGCWLGALGAICLWVLAGALNVKENAIAFLVLGGIALLLGSIIYALIKVPVLSPAKIDDQFVWAKRVGQPFLAELPEWTGR